MYSGFQDFSVLEILSYFDYISMCVICVNLESLTGELMEESHMMNCWTKNTALDAFYHCVFKHYLLVCPNYTSLLNCSAFCVLCSLLMIS